MVWVTGPVRARGLGNGTMGGGAWSFYAAIVVGAVLLVFVAYMLWRGARAARRVDRERLVEFRIAGARLGGSAQTRVKSSSLLRRIALRIFSWPRRSRPKPLATPVTTASSMLVAPQSR